MKNPDLKQQSQQDESDSDSRADELEMLNLTERGIEDFRLGRTLSQEEVRARLQKKHAHNRTN